MPDRHTGTAVAKFHDERDILQNAEGERYRWVVERTFAWLDQFKRLLVRYDRRADIHEAFLALRCCLVCFRTLQRSF